MSALLSLLHKENKSQIEMHIAYCADRRKYDFSYLNSEQAAAELAAMQEWKDEVIEACIVDWIEPTTPKETIARLISENVKQALDPAISEPVAKLHDRIKELEAENITMYGAILEAADMGSLRCKVELQRIARNDGRND